jgi:hypothetical protein
MPPSHSHGRHNKAHYSFNYHERMECLWYNGSTQALTIILAAQLIYFNLHYVIGASLTVLSSLLWLIQVVMGFVERRLLHRRELHTLNTTLDVHYCINRAYVLLYAPFLVWTVVLMYERVDTVAP